MPTADVQLLGRFQVAVDGRPISNDAWRNRRAADLVKMLALAPAHRLRREAIMNALWPELPPDAAAANLRKAAHYARRAAEAENFVSSASGVLELGPGWQRDVDAVQFEAAVHNAQRTNDPADAARAADLYGGDLLPDDATADWTDADRTRLRGEYLRMLRAAGYWAQVAQLDPWDEPAHRALMRTALYEGNGVEALRVYDGLCTRLRDDLGLEPSGATQKLAGNIRVIEEPGSAQADQVRSLIARGRMNYWGRVGLDEAEQVAADARDLALEAGLATEAGEASTLLAVVSVYTGSWWQRFRTDFQLALGQPRPSAVAIFDALVCFTEYGLDGPGRAGQAAQAAEDARAALDGNSSGEGETLVHLMSGESHLVSGRLDAARPELEHALRCAEECDWATGQAFILQRLAEAHLAGGDRPAADALAKRAVVVAHRSDIVAHVLVRALAATLRTADDPGRALAEAERMLRSVQSCEPCGISYLFAAIDAATEVGRIDDARIFLEDGQRLFGLWGGGPWQGAIWFARGRIREAEGEDAIARVFYEEAARSYAAEARPLDEARSRTAASLGLAV